MRPDLTITTVRAYHPVAEATQAAQSACDAWIAANKAYEQNPSMENFEALKVAHKKWQEAVKTHSAVTAKFTDWHIGRKLNRGMK